ncbi:GM11030 [Drosophila sechellia]|uniref:GM11030 n=2 Tax=Drosophila sechellia TaxID=7238 RepID=B4HX69_DROSE|nr:GM11030 [Drosophila sechellia]
MPTDNSVYGKLKRCYQLHINGSVEYSRGRCDEALKYFQELLSVVDPMDIVLFKLSFLRLGQLALQRKQYELAEKAFNICLPTRRKNFIANYGMGLTLYHLNRLEEAIPYLSRCTEVDIFIPDVWGYLATINLRLSRNKTALECWKVAKLYPEVSISKSVYAELDKIQYSDVHLLVDDDGNPTEKMTKMDFIPL